ncbi:hypothetical protein F4861DRAFT_546438 [Xylaria intraflava]|nr:hypothetical protein F4861DRAFT_546438 [Xylaria intraflava]
MLDIALIAITFAYLSTASGSQQPFLSDIDDDDVRFLRGSDHVYLTRTKDGKPALGRKKHGKLLPEFSFDILSESFGVSSRYEYERQARVSSVRSQSSGLVTAPVTPRRGRGTTLNNNSQVIHEYRDQDNESPAARHKTSSVRASSTPAPVATRQNNRQNASNLRWQTTDGVSSSYQSPPVFNEIPSPQLPPPPPAPPSTVGWQTHTASKCGIVPNPTDSYDPGCQHTHLSGYSPNGSVMPPGTSNWASPQYHVAAQTTNPLGNALSQATAMPLPSYNQHFPQHQTSHAPCMQTVPGAPSVNMHPYPGPPPPPPSQDWLRKFAAATGHSKEPHHHADHDCNTENAAEHGHRDKKLSPDLGQMQDKSEESEGVKKRLSRRIRHVHVCGGCGKKRSRKYHKNHPLKRGEIPALNYCYNCLKDAAETDFDSSDGESTDDIPKKKVHIQTDKPDLLVPRTNSALQNLRKARAPSLSADENNAVTKDKYIFKQTRHGSRRAKKPVPFRPLTKLFSCGTGLRTFPQESDPISSSEEARSRDSSVVSSRRVPRVVPRPRISRGYGRRNTFTADKTPVKTQWESEEEPQNEKRARSRFVREVESEDSRNEDEARATRNDKSEFARSRTHTRARRPQPRPQSVPLNTDPSHTKKVSGPALTTDEGCILPHPEAEILAGPGPMSRSARADTHPKSSNPAVSTQKNAAVNQMAAQGRTIRVEKNRVPPLATVNLEDTSGGIHNGNKQAFMDRFKKSTNAASEVISKGSADNLAGKSSPSFPSDEPQIPLSHKSVVNPDDATYPHQIPLTKNSERQPLDGDASDIEQVSDTVFNWHEHAAPMDAPYASRSRSSHVLSDLWADYQVDTERAAEEMAEQDLASAGKIFDSLSSTFGSTTSGHPKSSFMASNLSIVTYDSDSDHSDSDASTVGIQEARMAHSIQSAEDTPVKQIEFASENDQKLKSAMSSTLTESFGGAYPRHSDGSKTKPRQILYPISDDGQSDDVDMDYSPSPAKSSLVGHTGHSSDDIVMHSSARGGLTTTATGLGSRFMRLISA